ncbi:MAG: hypothetical protein V1861_00220 [Candidatus Micrarchaeota archaeon]
MNSNTTRNTQTTGQKTGQPETAREAFGKKFAPLDERGMDCQRALHDDYDLRSQAPQNASRLGYFGIDHYDHNLF